MVDDVDVWVAPLDKASGWEPVLSRQERERAEGFLRPEAAKRWVAARLALRRVLSGYLRESPAEIELSFAEGGKPRLAEGELEFNLSHSGDLALIAVSWRRPIGVDLERVEPDRDLTALAERALDAEEVASLRETAPGQRTAAFYAAWTRHEARRKCLGVGLTGQDPGTPVAVRNIDVAPGYAAAVAVAGERVGPVRERALQPS